MKKKNQNKIAFVGSFDYFHEGHWDIVLQVLDQYDVIYIIIANNPQKQSHSLQARKDYLKNFLQSHPVAHTKIYIKTTSGLTTSILKKLHVNEILRGYRDTTDQIYEDQLYATYLTTMPTLKRVLVASRPAYVNYASSKLKQE